jgi:enoyl-CoA hydratase/carnithine racemase
MAETTMASAGEIQIERDERDVVTLWLSNPGRRNALSDAMVMQLCEVLPPLADDPSCRAVVLRGRDGAFCAGRDLVDLGSLQSAGHDAAVRMYGLMRRMNEVIYYSPHPVISVIERYALGIATMLVSWTDIAIAEDSAVFGYPEVHHGITPYGAVPTMLNTMSQKAMFDLLLTGRRVAAPEALRLGILSRVVAAGELERTLGGVVEDLGRGSGAAIRRSKQFVRECESLTYQQGIATAAEKHVLGVNAPEMREGVAAFLDKRKTG